MPGRTVVKGAADQASAVPTPTATVDKGATNAGAAGDEAGKPAAADRPRNGAKRMLILAMMQRDGGATLVDLAAAAGWLPHTTRAALTGLRKSGIAIVRSRDEQTTSSVYRIEQPASAAAA